MAFHERRFPLRISYGTVGGPGFSTGVTVLGSGVEEFVPRWAMAKHAYNVKYGIKSWDDMFDLRRFYQARHGVANGFRFFDWMDHTSASNGRDAPAFDDQVIGTGDGGTTVFQLRKTYQDGSESRARVIKKPIHGETIEGSGFGAADMTFNVLAGVNGSQVTEAGNWSVNTATGEITFLVAPPSGQTVTAGFGFDTPARFGIELDRILPMTADDFDNMDIDDIPIVEFTDPSEVYEDVNPGGAKSHGEVSTPFSITMLEGRVHTWNDTAGTSVILPPVASTPLGAAIFYLLNTGASSTGIYYDDGTTLVGTAAQDVLIMVALGLDGSGNRTWYLA